MCKTDIKLMNKPCQIIGKFVFWQIIHICLEYICYDPNYNYDDDDDESSMDTEMEEEDEGWVSVTQAGRCC